jgi:uncharacterized membrane protein
MVWYQKFEYAIGHWLQKAAEHMLGCVLCSPGCFSLFRGSAIMDDNVMRTYATKSTEARHYVQYDQGWYPFDMLSNLAVYQVIANSHKIPTELCICEKVKSILFVFGMDLI